MGKLSLYLLGDLRIELDGMLVETIATEKARALLVYLALEGGRPLRREVLAELLWPERPPGVGRASLRQAIGNLRLALGDRDAPSPFILTQRDHIQFNPSQNVWIDTIAVSDLIQNVRDHGHQQGDSCQACESRLTKAIDLYKGDFLADYSLPDTQGFSEWATIQREALHRKLTTALSLQVELHEAKGAYDEACDYARKLVRLEPWSEDNHRILIRLLAITGRRSRALRQFNTCKRILHDEFNAAPTEETLNLYQQILDGEVLPIMTPDIATHVDQEGKTAKHILRRLRYSIVGVGATTLIAIALYSMWNLSLLDGEVPAQQTTSNRSQPPLAVVLGTRHTTSSELAALTSTPTPTPLPYRLSVLITGEGDAPIPWAFVTMDGVTGEKGTQWTDDLGMVSWDSVPGETVNLFVGAQGHLPIETSLRFQGEDKQVTIGLERDPFGMLSSEACAPGEDLIYLEDFQDYDASGWPEITYHALGWELISHPGTPGNIVARNPGSYFGNTYLENSDLNNAVWRFSIMFSGKGLINFSWAQTGGFHTIRKRYWVGFDPITWLHGINRLEEDLDLLLEVVYRPIEENVWHQYEVSYYEGKSEVWIDGIRLFSYSDPNPFSGGLIGFQIFDAQDERFVAYLDDISICALNAPFDPNPSPVD